jgi:hypothetical protein
VEILQPPWSRRCPLVNTRHLNSQRHLLSLPCRAQLSINCSLGTPELDWPPFGAYDQILITVRQLRVCWCGGFSDEGRSVVYNCRWSSPAQSFSGPNPLVLVTICYCLRFETSPFVASYDSQGYPECTRPCLHTGPNYSWVLSLMLRPMVSRPVCLEIKHPSGAYDQIFITCVTVTVLFLWGALSDERSSLSFVWAAGLTSATQLFSTEPFFITTLRGQNRKHRFQQYPDCCRRVYRSDP